MRILDTRVFNPPKIEPPIVSTDVYNHYKRLINYSNIKYDTNVDFMELMALDLVRNSSLDNKLESIIESYDDFTENNNRTISFSNIISEVSDFNSKNNANIEWKDIVSALTISNKYLTELENVNQSSISSLCSSFISSDGESLSLEEYLKNNNKSINYVDVNFRDKNKISNSYSISAKQVKNLDEVLDDKNLSEEDREKVRTNLEKIRALEYPSDGQLEFVKQVYPGAKANQDDFKIFTSITLAQAILESNWGTSELYLKGKNIFGIKAFDDWKGETITMSTNEWDENLSKNTTIKDAFRKYDDYDGSIIDHSLFLSLNERYAESGVFSSSNYKDQARAIKDAGYATDPEYANNLIELIEQNELFIFDN